MDGVAITTEQTRHCIRKAPLEVQVHAVLWVENVAPMLAKGPSGAVGSNEPSVKRMGGRGYDTRMCLGGAVSKCLTNCWRALLK